PARARSVLRVAGDAPRCKEGRWQAPGAQLRLHRPLRDGGRDDRQRGAAPPASVRAGPERGRHGAAHARLPGRARDRPRRAARGPHVGPARGRREPHGAALVLHAAGPHRSRLPDRDAMTQDRVEERLLTIPNALSMLRLVLAPVLLWLGWTGQHRAFLAT